MRKIGIYYAYWTRDWDADFVPFVHRVKSLGFDVLEVNSGTITRLSPGERAELRAVALDEGVSLSFCIGLTPEHDVSSADSGVRSRGVEFLKRMSQAVGELGGGPLSGIIYGSWPASLPKGETDRRPYVERSIASLRAAAPVAEENEVVLNVEVVNRFEQFMLNCVEEGVEYVDAVGSRSVRLLLDTFHMNIEEDSIVGAIKTAGNKLGHFHVGENNRKAPGRGHIPWEEIGQALQRIGYGGYVVMEPFVVPGGEVGRDIKVYRDLRGEGDLDTEARRACEFVRQRLG